MSARLRPALGLKENAQRRRRRGVTGIELISSVPDQLDERPSPQQSHSIPSTPTAPPHSTPTSPPQHPRSIPAAHPQHSHIANTAPPAPSQHPTAIPHHPHSIRTAPPQHPQHPHSTPTAPPVHPSCPPKSVHALNVFTYSMGRRGARLHNFRRSTAPSWTI